MEDNGKPPEGITIIWDEEHQGVKSIVFDPNKFRSLQFVKAVLLMAQEHAEQSIKLAQVNAMRQAAQEQVIGQNIRQKILGGR